MMRSPLALHLPDADSLTGSEIAAALDLSPAAFLVLVYAQWDADKGAAQQVNNLVRALGHDRLYVRFHADPHPPGHAKAHGGPEAWGRLCAKRMGQYYGSLGVELHAILANEVDADYEGGLSAAQASDFYRRALGAYRDARPQDILHVPAPTGAPQTHREHLERFKADGWVRGDYVIDGHGYDGDLENVVNVLDDVFPGHPRVITETNNLDDFGWPIELIRRGRVDDVIYFILNWARGGEGRVKPPSSDDAAKQMSLLRFPDRYAQFKATVTEPLPGPAPDPEPEPEPEPVPDDFPLPTWTPAPVDIIDGCVIVADEYLIPRDLLLGLCLAECGEGLQSFDRWGRATTEALIYIEDRDKSGLQNILQRLAAIPTNDISFGPCHQTWRWSPEYNGQPYDLDSILRFRKLYIEDHGHALRVAAKTLASSWQVYGPDKTEVLARYNKPDGSASASVRARYAAMLALAPSMLPAGAPPSTGVRYEDYRDPAPAGRFAHVPKGIILHGSRSGKAGNPKATEYLGTARYEVNNTVGVGWHATIGENVVAVHLTPQEWGWNARGSSAHWIGVELAQATVDEPITDAQVAALADYIKTRLRPAWPTLPMSFSSHAELDGTPEYGPRDGKTDVFPLNDRRTDDLRARLLTALGPAPPAPAPGDQLASLISAVGYLSGDVADRLELARAGLDDGIARPTAAMLKAELLANLEQAWRNIDRAYAEIGLIGDEMRRVGKDVL